MRTRRGQALYALTAAIALTGTANAHSGQGLAGGFLAGFAHPLGGIDHLLAMVSVGIWGAFLGKPLIWQLPVVFPFMMVVGGGLGIAGVPMPFVEQGIAASVLVLGLAIAAAWNAPRYVALAIVGMFALFHGHAHGAELPHAANAAAYSAGFVICTGLLHLTGIAIGLLAASRTGKGVLRVGGIAIALMGIWLFIAGLGYVSAPPDLPSIV